MKPQIGRCTLLLVGVVIGWLGEPSFGQNWRGRGQVMVMEWRCSRCNGILGEGAVRPSVDICTHCRARMIGGGAASKSQDPSKQAQELNKMAPVYLGLVLVGVVCVVCKTINAGRKATPPPSMPKP